MIDSTCADPFEIEITIKVTKAIRINIILSFGKFILSFSLSARTKAFSLEFSNSTETVLTDSLSLFFSSQLELKIINQI